MTANGCHLEKQLKIWTTGIKSCIYYLNKKICNIHFYEILRIINCSKLTERFSNIRQKKYLKDYASKFKSVCMLQHFLKPI